MDILAEAESKDMTVIILVDGLQNLYHEPKSKKSPFYSALSTLASLSNNSGKEGHPFVICCASATCELPVNEWLGPSSQ